MSKSPPPKRPDIEQSVIDKVLDGTIKGDSVEYSELVRLYVEGIRRGDKGASKIREREERINWVRQERERLAQERREQKARERQEREEATTERERLAQEHIGQKAKERREQRERVEEQLRLDRDERAIKRREATESRARILELEQKNRVNQAKRDRERDERAKQAKRERARTESVRNATKLQLASEDIEILRGKIGPDYDRSLQTLEAFGLIGDTTPPSVDRFSDQFTDLDLLEATSFQKPMAIISPKSSLQTKIEAFQRKIGYAVGQEPEFVEPNPELHGITGYTGMIIDAAPNMKPYGGDLSALNFDLHSCALSQNARSGSMVTGMDRHSYLMLAVHAISQGWEIPDKGNTYTVLNNEPQLSRSFVPFAQFYNGTVKFDWRGAGVFDKSARFRKVIRKEL